MVTRVIALGHQEDNLFLDVREDPFLEQNKPHPAEPPHEVLTDSGRVVDGQQLRGNDEPQPAPGAHEQRTMDRESSP